jgi:hypothetical protein
MTICYIHMCIFIMRIVKNGNLDDQSEKKKETKKLKYQHEKSIT